jgi:GNAT superfamily N-acetyltransferase
LGEGPHIVEISRQGGELGRFLKVPFGIQGRDPCWVAPILRDAAKVLSDANPFHRHASVKLWICRMNGRDVGRIAGIIDRAHNEFHGQSTAFFGFFESVNDPKVGKALIDAASAWAKAQGMTRLLGPANPSMNEECGMLVEGFGLRSVFMTQYNPPYYLDLMDAAGFGKARDLLAYYCDLAPEPLARLNRLAAGVFRRHPELEVRPVNRRRLAEDLRAVKEVYNDAWENNWGFVPMGDAEVDFLADRLKPIVNDELFVIARAGDEPVAFQLSVPDYNEVFARLRGRLLSWRVLGALPYLLGWRTTRLVRVFAMGVRKGWRQRGVDAVMFAKSLGAMLKAGHRGCDISWMLEDNVMVQRATELFGGRLYKRYRMYEKAI